MNPKVMQVEILKNYKLLITFTNNEKKIFDIEKYLHKKFWSSLRDENVFKTVKVSGGSIEWSNGVDFCPDEVYENSSSTER